MFLIPLSSERGRGGIPPDERDDGRLVVERDIIFTMEFLRDLLIKFLTLYYGSLRNNAVRMQRYPIDILSSRVFNERRRISSIESTLTRTRSEF